MYTAVRSYTHSGGPTRMFLGEGPDLFASPPCPPKPTIDRVKWARAPSERNMWLAQIVLAVGAALCSLSLLAAEPPYPASPVIGGISWDRSSHIQKAPGSDLWPVTWASDGSVYTAWGDGGGFGGTNTNGRVSLGIATIDGTPPNIVAVNINGGTNSKYPATWGCSTCGKTSGIISVGGVLYTWINMQNSSTPDSKLAWSPDRGKTWHFSSWKFPDSADPRFFPSTFLNFGRDNANARDGYVYSYGGKWIWTQGGADNVYLMRVPKNSITIRSAYEFFSGFDGSGNPMWTMDISRRQPVFTDPNGVNNKGLVNVVFDAPLGRYLLISSHRPPGSSIKTGLGRLGVFDAPEPWGPWTTVAYYADWLGLGDSDALGYNISTKWISTDGNTFWMTYSAPSTDQFNLIKGTFTPATPIAGNPPTPPTGLKLNVRGGGN